MANLKDSVWARRNIMSDNEIYPNYGSIQRRFSSQTSQPNDKEFDPELLLNQDIEGFDYDTVQNDIMIAERIKNAQHHRLRIGITRYVILFFIGFLTGLSAFTFDYCIDKLAGVKFMFLKHLFDKYSTDHTTAPGFVWCSLNAILVGIASILVVYIAPVAAGSGIPQIKCFLNGINVPKVNRLTTLVTKGIGVVLSVSGGLAVGKEGPMIHTGSAIAAGLSQGRLTLCKMSFKFFRVFRNDQEKRDFVSAGAAAGVAAAFGAPVGGLLFSLEEGASFVNQGLTWKILFTSMISYASLNLFKSIEKKQYYNYTQGGLVSFGSMDYLSSYDTKDILVFAVQGVIGGLLGALFIRINVALTKFRKKNVNKKITKVMEAMLIAALTAAIAFTVMSFLQDCRSISQNIIKNPLRMYCSDSEYNSVSELFFQTPEKTVRSLLHNNSFSMLSLGIFIPIYFFVACITYGVWVPSGLFIPTLLMGAAWGRLIGLILQAWQPETFDTPEKYALIGAAAMLGGVVRMTVSLTVILMEATGNIIIGLPLILTLVIAKYVGDIFNEGIYDSHIDLGSFALLPWQPEGLSVTKRAYDVMSSPVVHLDPIMRVVDLVERIEGKVHQAYPVTDGEFDAENHRFGTLFGLISSRDLALLLHKRIFEETELAVRKELTMEDYDDAYPNYKTLKEVVDELLPADLQEIIDLRPYMNQAPYRVPEMMTFDRVFYLFRLLGLRHLPVVDNANQLRGMITRKDIRRFRFEPKNGDVHIEELYFSKQVVPNSS